MAKRLGISCTCRAELGEPIITYLDSIPNQKDRQLLEYKCPKCHKVISKIKYYDVAKKHYKSYSISEIEAMRYKKNPYVTKVETGSKQNLSWLYGNRGNIYNFNGKLIGKQNY